MKTGIKLRVNPEQSKRVQEICFENGVMWEKGKIVSYLGNPFLYILQHLSYDKANCEEEFNSEKNLEEIDADLFIRTNGSCEEITNPKEISQDIVNQINEELRVDNTEDIYKGLGTTGFVKSALNKVVKEQCQKLSKEINEAQPFTMLQSENIKLKKKIENLHIALKKKVEKKEQILLLRIHTQAEENKKIINEKDTIIKYLEGRLNEK